MGTNWKRSGLVYIAVLLIGVALVTVFLSTPDKTDEIPLSEAIAMSQGNTIEKIVVDGEWLTPGHGDDHLWDCEVMQMVLAQVAGLIK